MAESPGTTGMTAQQTEAAQDVARDVCLAAGAGCGKTRVLVEHYLCLIESGLGCESLVAITFTEKAAAEMVERLRSSCRLRAAQSRSAEEKAKWLEAATGVEMGAASTIHSLAGRLLRAHAIEAGLDPQLRTMDEMESRLTMEQACRDELRARLENSDATLAALLGDYSLRTLQESVRALLQKREPFRALSGNLKGGPEAFMASAENEIFDRIRRRVSRLLSDPEVSEAAEVLARLRSAKAYDPETINPLIQEIETVRVALNVLRDLASGSQTRQQIERFQKIEFAFARTNAGSGRDWGSAEAKKEAGSAYKTIRETLIKPAIELLRVPGEAERKDVEAVSRLVRLASAIQERYEAQKQKAGGVDFDDLIDLAARLLKGNREVRALVAGKLRAVLVDELQDISPVQWDFIKALCSSGAHLFVVGDEKQSIYRFRQADVAVFQTVQEAMRAKGSLKELSVSFRFHPGLNAFYNDFFPALMRRSEGDEPFRSAFRPVTTSRTETPGKFSVEFLFADGPDGLLAREGRMLEARLLAARINEMIKTGLPRVWDNEEKAFRPPRLADIAILARVTSDLDVYERALREADLEYCVASGASFYETQVVTDIYYLARALARPGDEYSLTAALRGPFFSLSDDALVLLAAAGGIARGITDSRKIPGLSELDALKLEQARQTLRALRADYGRVPLADLLEKAFDTCGYEAYLLGTFMGHQHLANVLKLMRRLRRMERSGFSPAETISQLEELVSSPPRESEAVVVDPEHDHLQLMTIHKAKGLEFPIVFIPDLGRARIPRPEGVVVPSLGALLPPKRFSPAKTEYSLIHQLIMDAEREEETEESKRLLYVAATRAKDHLVFSSYAFPPARSEWLTWLDDKYQVLEAADGAIILCGTGAMRVARTTPGPTSAKKYHPLSNRFLEEIAEKSSAGPVDTELAEVVKRRVEPVQVKSVPCSQFSVTALADYRRCPALYYFRHLHGLQGGRPGETGDEIDALGRGELYHRFFELLARGVDLKSAAAMAALNEEELAGRMKETYRRLKAKGLIEGIPAGESDYPEMEFVVPVGGRLLAGKMDLVRVSGNTVSVLDYKTENIKAGKIEATAEKYGYQMRLYALAAFKLWKEAATVRTVLVFTAANLQHETLFERNDVEKLEAEALNAMEGVEGGRFEGKRPCCGGCPFDGWLCVG